MWETSFIPTFSISIDQGLYCSDNSIGYSGKVVDLIHHSWQLKMPHIKHHPRITTQQSLKSAH